MTHERLIKKITETAKMTNCKPNWTPALQATLSSDKEGKLQDQKEWNCASIVGLLSCGSDNTGPDITFAVSQVARVTAQPRVSHAKAIKSIARYLAGT